MLGYGERRNSRRLTLASDKLKLNSNTQFYILNIHVLFCCCKRVFLNVVVELYVSRYKCFCAAPRRASCVICISNIFFLKNSNGAQRNTQIKYNKKFILTGRLYIKQVIDSRLNERLKWINHEWEVLKPSIYSKSLYFSLKFCYKRYWVLKIWVYSWEDKTVEPLKSCTYERVHIATLNQQAISIFHTELYLRTEKVILWFMQVSHNVHSSILLCMSIRRSRAFFVFKKKFKIYNFSLFISCMLHLYIHATMRIFTFN